MLVAAAAGTNGVALSSTVRGGLLVLAGVACVTPGVVTTSECRKDTQIFNARTLIGILI